MEECYRIGVAAISASATAVFVGPTEHRAFARKPKDWRGVLDVFILNAAPVNEFNACDSVH